MRRINISNDEPWPVENIFVVSGIEGILKSDRHLITLHSNLQVQMSYETNAYH